jgi:hypothetical protein
MLPGIARAQVAGFQLVTKPASYQFQVPADWVPGSLDSPGDTLIGSAASPAAAYVYVKMPAGQTSDDRLQSLLAEVLMATDVQSAYTVTNPSSPVQVLGADLAVGAASSFQWDDGTTGQEYVIAAIRGANGYALVVDLPAEVDAASPSVAQTILGSFHILATTATPVAAR